jgi:hypothetical protein
MAETPQNKSRELVINAKSGFFPIIAGKKPFLLIPILKIMTKL